MGTRRLLLLCVTGPLAVGLIAAGLTGCGGGRPRSSSTVGVTMSAAPPSAARPTGSPSPAGSPPAAPMPVDPVPSGLPVPTAPPRPKPGAEQTLTGQVEAGAERGCLVLHDATGLYQLLGGDPTIVYAGSTVSVTGHVVTGIMSFCMQGTPFQIDEARRI